MIAGGTGQVGGVLRRALAAAGREVVVLSRHPRAALEPGVRHVGWDARTLGEWAGGGRRRGRRREPRRPLGQLPLHRRQPAPDDGLQDRLDPRDRRRDRERRPPARHLAADEHRDHLRRPLRRARQPGQRRGDRDHRRRGARTRRSTGSTASGSPGAGSRRSPRPTSPPPGGWPCGPRS